MIWPPLAVCAGDKLNEPHAPALPHAAVQSTPRSFVSVLVAARVACEPSIIETGKLIVAGALGMVTTIGGTVTIFTVAVAEIAELVVDCAVIVTVPPVGTEFGAL
jgi:hypothetical protein